MLNSLTEARARMVGRVLLLFASSVAVAHGSPIAHDVSASSSDRGRDLATPFLLGFGTLVAHQLQDTDRDASMLDGSALDAGMEVGNQYGEGFVLGTAAVGLVAAGRVLDDRRTVDVGTDLARSLAISWGVVWVLKPTIDAERPDGGRHSFPSGHTATAFAAAPVFAAHCGDWVGGAAYSLATLTALARVEERRHHLADVVAGAAIGVIVGRKVAGDAAGQRRELRLCPDGLCVDLRF